MTRNQPPVAGAIKWSRSLFARVKQTMNKLAATEQEMMQDILGQQVGDGVRTRCTHGSPGLVCSGWDHVLHPVLGSVLLESRAQSQVGSCVARTHRCTISISLWPSR